MLYSSWSQRTRCLASHNHQWQYLSNSKTTSNSCCIHLGLTGPDGVQVTIISYTIYQTLKLPVTHAVLTLVTLDKMAYTSHNHQLQYLSNSKTTSDLCWNICKLSFLIDNFSEWSLLCINVYLIFEAQQILETFGTWLDLFSIESYSTFKWR